ncbi:MAG: ThiF family adenylyltransferase, partial [Arcanobacterium sp.]|nr:ThiF family adenylyltransferase [Arcanobacterium sp.]
AAESAQERNMFINEGLGVFWNAVNRAQIGLDPRTGAQLNSFSPQEVALVDALTRPHTETEFRQRAQQLHIPYSRAQRIIALLDSAGMLTTDLPQVPDAAAYWRIHHAVPTHRAHAHVHIPRLDPTSQAIALALARAGIGVISTADSGIVTPHDHPLWARRYLGMRKVTAFTAVLREENPQVRIASAQPPDLVLLTSSHGIDPYAASRYTASGIRVFHAWVEEVDAYLGPLTVAHETPCATCVNLHRVDADPAWAVLAPQAFSAQPVIPESSTLSLIAALSAREILTEIDGHASLLRGGLYRIPPSPEPPEILSVPFHSQCGCAADGAAAQFERTTSSTASP